MGASIESLEILSVSTITVESFFRLSFAESDLDDIVLVSLFAAWAAAFLDDFFGFTGMVSRAFSWKTE